jgi:Mn2+/Fe2+ NRAMP family transporter
MSTSAASSPAPAARGKGVFRSLGPSLITAAVVVGPGTITVASKLGAGLGYALLWVILLSVTFMWLFTTMAARVAILNKESLLSVAARLYGRPLAIAVGALAFLVTTAFQLSNYLACATALTALSGVGEPVWIAVVGAGGLVFLFVRQLYGFAEKAMSVLVFAMVAAFFVNLVASKPALTEVATGLVPRAWPAEFTGLAMAMVATTFSVIAALYQGALARQKGWREEDLGLSRREAAVGLGLLATISCVIMITAGTVLRGVQVDSAAVMAEQFRPVLGPVAVWLFSLGFLAAGFSSVVINPMVGGGLFSDGLGLGAGVNERWPRILTAVGMVAGMVTAWLTLRAGSAIEGIVWAQRSTVLAVPLCAAVLIVLANDRRAVGVHRNGWVANVVAGLALAVLIALNILRLRG